MTAIAERCRLLLAGFIAAALLAAPATAGAVVGPGCPEVAVAQPFALMADSADYFLAPDGGFEQGGASWALRGRAEVGYGSEPLGAGGSIGQRSLTLAPGSTATSAPFCIGVEHRAMRFVANAAPSSELRVDVLYTDDRGRSQSERIGEVSGAGGWAPSDILPMVVNDLAAKHDNAMTVQLRFAPHGSGSWAIDDVFVDPYRVR